MSIFYAERGADVGDYHLRSQILLASPEDLMAAGQAGRGERPERTVMARRRRRPPAAAPMAT